MAQVDKNESFVVGKVLSAKAWDPNGKDYTNGSVSLDVNGTTAKVTVKLSVGKFDERIPFNKVFSQGNHVAVSKGSFTSWAKKDDNGVEKDMFQLETNMSNCYEVEAGSASEAVVSGKILSAKDDRALIEAGYWSKGPGKPGVMKQRKIRVQVPNTDLAKMVGKHITLVGTTSFSDTGPFVVADSIFVTSSKK